MRVSDRARESRYCLFKFTQEPLKEPQGPLVRLPTLKTSRALKYITGEARFIENLHTNKKSPHPRTPDTDKESDRDPVCRFI